MPQHYPKNRIPVEDFFEYAPDDVGAQAAVNHTACTAGEDRRGRLYVKRAEPNVVVAYCHNCGLSGYCIDGYTNVWHYRGNAAAGTAIPQFRETRKLELPRDTDGLWYTWPFEARAFMEKYGMGGPQYGVGYSPYFRRLVFSVFDEDGLVAYQLRRVFEDDVYPKYLTRVGPDKNRQTVQPHISTPWDGRIVICEDLISSLKLRLAGCRTYPLLGADLDIHHFTDLVKPSEGCEVVSWLDNDSWSIRNMSINTRSRLQMAGYKAGYIIVIPPGDKGVYTDPKNYTFNEIKHILTEVKIHHG